MWTKAWDLTRASAQGVTYLALAMMALLWFGIELNLANERAHAERAAIQKAENLARLFEEHIRRVIAEIDKTVLFLRRAYQEDPERFDLRAWVENQHHLDDLHQIAIIGADGVLAATNLGRSTQRIDLSDREHFRVHLGEGPDHLFVSKPVLGRASGRWSIQLTRRINGPGNSFAGVVVASLDPYRLSRFLASIDLGPDGAIAVIGTDRILRAQGGLTDDTLGREVTDSGLFEAIRRRPTGLHRATATAREPARLLAYRALSDPPLVVTVGIAEDTIAEGSRRNAPSYRAAGAVMTAILVVVIALGTRQRLHSKRAYRALRASQAQTARKGAELEITLDNMSQGIIMVDAEGRIAVMNRRAIEMLDLPAERFLGTRALFSDLLAYQWEAGEFGEDGAALDPQLRAYVMAGGLASDLAVYERARPNGTVIEVRSKRLPDGGVVRTYTDVTERKRGERALAEARDRAEAASEARSTFLATMSHEIRTPLNGVIGMATILEDTKLDEDQRRCVSVIRTCGQALLLLIDDILDLSKLESSALEIERAPVSPRTLIEGAAAIVEPRIEGKGVTLVLTLAADLPAMILSDGGRIRQVLLNLLGNAAKFTERGEIEVKVTRAGGAGEPRLRFEVRDTGIGIPASARDKLFKGFSQVDASIARRFGGTGLGLAISKRIVEAMGGEIGFSSTEGVGSTFWFELPFETAPRDAPPAPLAEPDTDIGFAFQILIAEDNAVNQEVTRLILEKMGHRVAIVADGAAAVEACRAGVIDLVLMDMQMPGMDGLAATRAIRALPGAAGRVPIVGLTANALAEDRAACLAAGMDDFVTKPIDRGKLESAVALHAGGKRSFEFEVLDPNRRSALETEIGAEAMAHLLRTFWNDTAATIEALGQAQARRDEAEIAALMHRLKGAAANVGYAGIMRAAAEGDAAVADRLRRLLREVERAMTREFPAQAA